MALAIHAAQLPDFPKLIFLFLSLFLSFPSFSDTRPTPTFALGLAAEIQVAVWSGASKIVVVPHPHPTTYQRAARGGDDDAADDVEALLTSCCSRKWLNVL